MERTEKRNGKQMIFIPRTPVTMKLNGTDPGLRRREDLPHPPRLHPRCPRDHVLHLRRRRGKLFPECKFLKIFQLDHKISVDLILCISIDKGACLIHIGTF